MPDYYNKLKLEFFEKFRKAEADVKATEHAGGEFPIPVTDELYYVVVCVGRAEEELAKGNRKEALENMQEAVNHVRRASSDILEYRFLLYSRKARAATDELKGDEDLASTYVPNYREVHAKNLFEIGNIIKSEKFPSKDSPEYRKIYEEKTQKIHDFLSDFEASKPALAAAKKKEKQAIQFQKTHIRLSLVAIVIAGLSILNNPTLGGQLEKFWRFLRRLITSLTT